MRAWALDWLIVILVELVLFPVNLWCLKSLPFAQAASVLLLIWLFQPAYKIYFHAYSGQTPGKRFARIQVGSCHGGALSFAQAVIRSLPNIVYTGAYFIGWVVTVSRIGENLFREASIVDRGRMISMVQPIWMGWLSLAIPLWLIISVVVMQNSPGSRTLHDYLARSLVVVKK